MSVSSFDEAKEFLYGQPVGEFVSERDALVKEIRSGGDRELANEVKTLRKPSAVAAEVNWVARADPAGVALILQAAELLREAQQGALEGGSINASELQQQYRAAIAALAQSARSRTAEVRAALEAATIVVASNDDLRSGSLAVVPQLPAMFDLSGTGSPPPAAVKKKSAPKKAALKKAAPEKAAPEKKAAKEPATAASEPPQDELAAKRAQRDAAAQATAEKAAQQQAEKEAKAQKAAQQQAEREQRAREKEEAQRQKQLEKQRQKRRKELTKQHRDAVRAHLAKLDAEHAASLAVEEHQQAITLAADEVTSLEEQLNKARIAHENSIEELASSQSTHDQAQQDATSAQQIVDDLVAELEAFNADS